MSQTVNYKFCSYHPSKIAVSRCEICKKYLCLNDLKIRYFLQSKPNYGNSLSGLGVSSIGTENVKKICLICYKNDLKGTLNPIKTILTFIPLILVFSIISTYYKVFSIISIFLIAGFVVIYVWQVIKYIFIWKYTFSFKRSLQTKSKGQVQVKRFRNFVKH